MILLSVIFRLQWYQIQSSLKSINHLFKRFVIYNNRYFSYFQALNFDNLVESKFQLCNNENKFSF